MLVSILNLKYLKGKKFFVSKKLPKYFLATLCYVHHNFIDKFFNINWFEQFSVPLVFIVKQLFLISVLFSIIKWHFKNGVTKVPRHEVSNQK